MDIKHSKAQFYDKNEKMNKNDKNIIIITSLGVIAVLIWTFSQYSSSQKEYTKKMIAAQNIQDQENAQKNQAENTTEKIDLVIPTISALELNRMLTNNEITLIDLRAPESYDNGHIKGSVSEDMIDLAQMQRTIVLITENGLEEPILPYYRNLPQGKTIYNLSRGIIGWQKEGFSLLSINATPSFATSAKVHFIEPRDFDTLIKNPQELQDALIIDTRRTGNYDNGHIPHAINIPLAEIEDRAKEIPSAKNIYVYGADEESSFNAGVLLYDLRHIGTKTMKGGFSAWEQYGYSIVQ